jgi:hypothetical protein
MDNSDDDPAPDSNRGFFAAGPASFKSSLSLSSVAVRLGRLIVIFFGARFGLGGTFEVLAEGGGSEIVLFLDGGGSFVERDVLGAVTLYKSDIVTTEWRDYRCTKKALHPQ